MHKGKINLQEILEYIELNITDEIIDSPFEYIEPEIIGKNLNLSIDCSEENISNKKSKSSVEYYEKESVKKIFNLLQTNLEKIYKMQELKNKYEDYSYVNKGIKSGYSGIAYTLREIQGLNILDKIDDVSSPYLMNGSVGVASVLLRYYLYTNKIKYKYITIDIMNSLENSLSLHTCLFEGMSGIANAFLDCYFIIGDDLYLNIANRIALDISNSLYNNDGFVSGYSRDGKNLSFTFDYGSSGVVMFLNRLLKNSKYNFIPYLDKEMEEISEQNIKKSNQ